MEIAKALHAEAMNACDYLSEDAKQWDALHSWEKKRYKAQAEAAFKIVTTMHPVGWWRVISPDGSLWCETSDEHEARDSMQPDDILQRLWVSEEEAWIST